MDDLPGSSRHNECALCMETFTSPRLLPCFHTFCLGCLQQLVRKQQRVDSFPCPTCRATVNIPPGGVETFQVNFYIEAEVESSANVVRTCDMCHKGPATHKCCDCDQFACDTCTAIHASIAATKSHTVLNLKNTKTAGTKGAVLVKKERYCSRHKEEKIRFFCTQCSTVICRDCKLTSHEGHATTDLSEKSSEAEQLVLQVTRRSRDNLAPKLRQALQEAQDQKKKVQASKKTILGTLEQRAVELKQEIDKSLAEAKGKLNQETDDVDKIASRCIDNMTQELACFLSLVDHAQRVAESGCDADILEMPTQMKQFFGVAGNSATSAVVQQQNRNRNSRAIAVNQPTSVSDCQLKSFTSEEWKVDVQLKNKNTLKTCEYCSKKYNTSNVNIQCMHCRRWYTENSDSCPSCGTVDSESESSEDVLASIQKAIPQYIGHVTRSRQSQADACDEFEDETYEEDDYCGELLREDYEDDYETGVQEEDDWGCTYPPQASVGASRPRSSANSTTSQIATEINAIRSILSGWQTLATEKKKKKNVW